MQVNILYSLERNFSAFIHKFTRNFTQYTVLVYPHRNLLDRRQLHCTYMYC